MSRKWPVRRSGRGLKMKGTTPSDAKAEGETVVLGGWSCSDSPDRGKCRWFSVKLDRTSAPWVFESGEPYRAIASLELLGTLASVVAFPPQQAASRKYHLSAGTDNLGNRHLISRFLTTKFPLCVVLMQLAWTLHRIWSYAWTGSLGFRTGRRMH